MGKTCLLVGAGAEVGLGLPSGPKYLLDTYFTKRPEMYEALRDFYRTRCILPDGVSDYRAEYLFTPQSATFHALAESLKEVNFTYVSDILGELEDDASFTNEQYAKLFEHLVFEDSNEPRKKEEIAEAAERIGTGFYGSLESLYAALIHPGDYKIRFWRLLNYYWSAYFSIVLPIISTSAFPMPDGVANYTNVLNNLEEISRAIWADKFVECFIDSDTYHAALRDKFDYVLTTNYTPYSRAFLKQNNKGSEDAVYLAGSLVEFESASTLEHRKCDALDPCELGCPFPYLMTRSPVKPIIDVRQLKTYSYAIDALDNSDQLVVLGYSFCDDDVHIATIVRNYLSDSNKKMLFFGYDDTSVEQHAEVLQKALRADADVMSRVQVLPVHDAHSPMIERLAKNL